MPESPNSIKMPRSASPVARAGAGDISERELSRERSNLHSTPPARLQPVHPKKQLFFTPVSKFTAGRALRSPQLERIRGCLEELTAPPPPQRDTPTLKRANMPPKAASMEDLTPIKRSRDDHSSPNETSSPCSRELQGPEQEAAARVARFMVVAAWRRRRDEVRCLRKTLEFQVSGSERLRLQVRALKSLLDSDNAKVRLAMRELDRLKQLVRDKDAEKAVLEKEKIALEDDVCAAEDRASELGIGWRNCRNELEGVRAAAALCEHALHMERAAGNEARAQRDRALTRLSLTEEDMAQQEELLSAAEADAAALRRDAADKQRALDALIEKFTHEREARNACTRECANLGAQLSMTKGECSSLRSQVEQLTASLAETQLQLSVTRVQLEWWPAPLTRLVGAVRVWLRRPVSAPAAILWASVPATHGCTQLAATTR